MERYINLSISEIVSIWALFGIVILLFGFKINDLEKQVRYLTRLNKEVYVTNKKLLNEIKEKNYKN